MNTDALDAALLSTLLVCQRASILFTHVRQPTFSNMRCHVFSTAPNQYKPALPLTRGGSSETETDAGTEDKETEDEMPLNVNLKRAKEEMIQKPSDLTKTYILADDYLKSASEALGLDLEKRLTESKILVNQKMMRHIFFHILKHDLEDWMSIHARLLGVSFVHKETYEFRGNLNKIHGHHYRRFYSCNHASKKHVKASEQDPDRMGSDL
ncbi:hypothetical protein KVV02_002661, partial [Mortierella alpina]